MRRLISVALVLCAAACQYDRLPDNADAPPVPECEAATTVCANDRYTECGPDGRFVRYELPNGGPDGEPTTLVMGDYECPLGCHATEPRCLAPLPSNGLASVPVGTSGVDLDFRDTSGGATLIATDADVSAGFVDLSEPSGATYRVPAVVVPQADGPEILVLVVRSFSVREGAQVLSAGLRALAIVSRFDILIAGTLGANWRGAPGHALAGDPCNAPPSDDATGGGGNVTMGGASSTGASGGQRQPPGTGGVPLRGGCIAGAIGIQGAGVPGGALQLVSHTRVHVASQGLVTVAGGKGRGFLSSADGKGKATGGGSGGLLVLEAPAATIEIGGTINGRGGSGGAAVATVGGATAIGVDGDDPSVSEQVPGGTCSACGTGGAGGTETTPPQPGTGAAPAIAGGGGSVGSATIRVRNAALPPAGSLRIIAAYGSLPTR